MAVTVLATTKARYTGASTGATSPAFNSTGATLIEVTVAYYIGTNGALPTVTDNKSNIWTPLARRAVANLATQKFYSYGQAGVGSGHTITVAGTNHFSAFVVRAYGGETLTRQVQADATVTSGTSLSTGAVTPLSAPALVTSGLAWNAGVLPTASSPMALVDSSLQVAGQALGVAASDELQTAATTRNPGWTWTGADTRAGCTACYTILPAPLVAIATTFWGSTSRGETSTGVDTTGATLLIADLGWGSSVNAPTISDSKGNTWIALTRHSGGAPHQFYYAKNALVGTNHTFSVTSTANSWPSSVIYALAGFDLISPFDGENGTQTALHSGTLASGAIAPTVNGTFIVSGFAYGNGTSATVDAGLVESVFLKDPSGSGQRSHHSAWKIQPTAAAINATWTYGGGSQGAAVSIAAFKPVAVPPEPAEGVSVTIAGIERVVRLGTLRISATMNGRDRCSGTLDILDASWRPQLADEVTITEDGVRIFGGVIDDAVESAILQQRDLSFQINATDFNVYPDRRYVISLASTAAMTLKAVLELLLPYLTPFGVTLSAAQVDGPLVQPFSWQYRKLSDLLDELTAATQYVWEIDYNKVLRMWLPGSEVAPFNIVDGDRRVIGDIVVNPLGTEYANRIIAICGPDAPQDVDDLFVSDGVSATFTLRYPFLNHYGVVSVNTVGTPPAVPTGFDVRVEGTPGSSTYTYAVSAWNGGGESAKTGTITVSNGQASPDSVNKIRLDWYPVTGAQGYVIYGRHGTGTWLDVNIYGEWVYYDDDDHDIEKSGAPTLPTGPHNETLSDTPGTADWYFNPIAKTITRNLGVLPAGTEVTIRYRANYPIILYADDAAEQTARGIHEVLIRDETALTLAQAQAVADNALAKYVEQRRLVTYETRGKGLAVGQSQTIVIARRDLNAQFLITEIETHDNLDSKLSRRVTLQEATTFQGSWRDVYTQWSQGGSGGAVVTTGGGGGTAGTAHHLTHEPGGSDPLFVDNDPVIGSLRTLGTGARQAAPGSALANYVLRADLDDVHQRGTRAAQPAATAVPAGTLYFVTDENVQERSTGTAWQAYTGVAAHHGTHEPGGSDPLAVDAAAATGSLRTLGTGATQAAPGSALADYLLLADVDQIIRRGTRAAQPAATAVTAGTLYCVTDERLEVERSNGTSWEPFARRRHVAIYPYTFSDTLTEPPTGNQVRLNAAHPYTAVTKIWLRYVGRDGVDYWRGLATKTGVSIVIQDENDHTIVAEFVTTADAIDKGTYFEWPVSHVAHSSTAFINNQTVLVLKL